MRIEFRTGDDCSEQAGENQEGDDDTPGIHFDFFFPELAC
jgi:hypothetical protein